MVQFTDLNISFMQGVDTKSDPKQLQTKLLVAENVSMQSPGQFQKRDGFSSVPGLSTGAVIANYQGELIAGNGTSLSSFSPEFNQQIPKGLYSPLGLTIDTIVRNTGNQTVPDSAYHVGTGYECFVWINNLSGTTTLQYSVRDSVTGILLVNQATVSSTATKAKVFAVGNFFVILYYEPGNLIYKAINTSTPTTLGSAVPVANDIDTTVPAYDCSVAPNGNLYVGYRKGTTQVSFYLLTSALALSGPFLVTTGQAISGGVALTTDQSSNVWYGYGTAAGDVRGFIVNSTLLGVVAVATTIESGVNTTNLTIVVNGTTGTYYYEGTTGAPTANYIRTNTMTITRTVGTASNFMRLVGLAGKAFRYQSTNYVPVIYAGQYTVDNNQNNISKSIEPSYFLVAHSSTIGVVGKLAPQLAKTSYLTSTLLPEFNLISTGVYSLAYLTQENLVTTSQGIITAQIGMNRARFDFTKLPPTKLQFATNLHLSGGQMTMYDGASVVEHGFSLFPENLVLTTTGSTNPLMGSGGIGNSLNHSTSSPNQVQYVAVYEWIDNQGQLHRSAPSLPLTVTIFDPTATTVTGNLAINNLGEAQIIALSLSDWNKLYVGQIITDTTHSTFLPAGTAIARKFTTAGPAYGVGLSQPASGTGTGDTFSTKDVYQIKIDVPTLTATSKQNVTIQLYRTQNLGTVFFRTGTSIVYNDPTVDVVTLTDVTPDLALSDPLYTTGGELENISPGAISVMTTYKNRVVYVTPESPLQWGYSKQVIKGFPVEFTDSFVENVDSRIGQITAMGVLDDKLILFGPTSKYVVVGEGPAASGVNNDFTDATKITGSTGSINQASILELPVGLVYQDPTRGIWLLDRALNEQYIGAGVEAYNAQTITSSELVPYKTQARFTLSNGTNLVLDYTTMQWEWDIYPQPAIDSTIVNNNIVYITAAGLIYEQTPGVFTDNGAAISQRIKTGWLAPQGNQGLMRVKEFELFGTYKSPHNLAINIYTDFVSTPMQTVAIPVLTAPGVYQFKITMKIQKCEAVMIEIIETPQTPVGEGMSLSGITIRLGSKGTLNNVKNQQSF